MYKIESRIAENHGAYDCHFEVWSTESTTAYRLFAAYERGVEPAYDSMDEHELILAVVESLLSRIAQKHERSLL